MSKSSSIIVPSPKAIKELMFPYGDVEAPKLKDKWTANVLLTPHGGVNSSTTDPTDQLIASILTYDGSDKDARYLRARLHFIESNYFHDLIFLSTSTENFWWYVVSDPSDDKATPIAIHGPFQSGSSVPSTDFFTQFKYAGTWKSVGVECDAFSAANTAKSSMWIWQKSDNKTLRRIMNTVPGNDFNLSIFGSFYFVDFVSISEWEDDGSLWQVLPKGEPLKYSLMITYEDILKSFDIISEDKWKKTSHEYVSRIIPGLQDGPSGTPIPEWTSKVSIQCFMIGQDNYPYYCQVWYDWDAGCQVTVFVQKGSSDDYDARFDEFLPKGKIGPAVIYRWDGMNWVAVCTQADAGFVPMPVPNFVEAGRGRCRAVFKGSPYFGNLSIWSVALGNAQSWADFWYWFDDSNKGVVFSLSPAGSLTLIDYQEFKQNEQFDEDKIFDPSPQLPACGAPSVVALAERPGFKV